MSKKYIEHCKPDSPNKYIDDIFVLIGRRSVIVCKTGSVLRCVEYDNLNDAVKKIEELTGTEVTLYCVTPR